MDHVFRASWLLKTKSPCHKGGSLVQSDWNVPNVINEGRWDHLNGKKKEGKKGRKKQGQRISLPYPEQEQAGGWLLCSPRAGAPPRALRN